MPEIPGVILRALRESRDWDEVKLARELRVAARAAGIPAAEYAGLRKMIPGWESGRHKPSRRYRLLYRRVFADEWGVNGAVPDLAMIAAARARRDQVPRQLPPVEVLLARAEASGREDIRGLAALVADLMRQVDTLQRRIAELEAGDGDGDGE